VSVVDGLVISCVSLYFAFSFRSAVMMVSFQCQL